MTLDDLSPEDREFILAFRKMDDISRLIINLGVQRIHEGKLTLEQFGEWAGDLLDRHRAGEALTLGDLGI